MKIVKTTNLPLDKFINWSLYDKNFGYYMKKNPFGKKGDFITAPKISRLFSETLAIWTISFWRSIGSPKKFNLIELGAGDGEMMKILIETLKNFPEFFNSCKFIIHEKSNKLISIQKRNINYNKVSWIKDIKKLNSSPTIFLANEFFDAIPVKQFFKKGREWFERYVDLKDLKNAKFINHKTNIKKLEKDLNFKISKKQNVIEYSPQAFRYLKYICEFIQSKDGGILIIDYGYLSPKMHESLQAIKNQKYSKVLENIGNSDITYNISFNLFKKFIKKFNNVKTILTNQKKFLTNMGIIKRAEIISKNQSFLKKANIFYRIKRLLDEKQMGELFKVMLIKNKKNKFKTGF